MDQKYKAYQEYNFRNDQRWQRYLDNLYPTPPMNLLEKRKRKWYRDNVDKDFDLNYNPQEEQKRQQNANQAQGPPPGANPYAYAYQQYAYEAYPQYKSAVALLYLGFVLTIPFVSL